METHYNFFNFDPTNLGDNTNRIYNALILVLSVKKRFAKEIKKLLCFHIYRHITLNSKKRVNFFSLNDLTISKLGGLVEVKSRSQKTKVGGDRGSGRSLLFYDNGSEGRRRKPAG